MSIEPDKKDKVVFTKMTIRTIVDANDPKPSKPVAYQFSNGRKFYRRGGRQ